MIGSSKRLFSVGRPVLAAARTNVSSASIDNKEVEMFSGLSSEWADELGPFNALHSLNRVRVPWIVGNIPRTRNSTPRVVDVGSGGGLLSIPLARSGLNVIGIDATLEAVEAAKKALESKPLAMSKINEQLCFEWTSVEDFSKKGENIGKFDAVIASEIIEHVADIGGFVKSLAALARPGAPLFFTTMNRTIFSKLAAIWIAEDILGVVPKGVHDWAKFITPAELSRVIDEAGCRVQSLQGLNYDPFGNKWSWTSSTRCNYALMAIKE
ncbi:unnamed protein product [Caenorhabditis bovis]|uniref:Ubiquinone biosynthesis O-methyltransferase, mitochondrial n=1 Tax=Caenorhabditis bovis TaxID=2654633 RepID=A0A8S1F3I9_9PELO|nr:unnamed protein product [Caenorhabditis bovis]